MRLLRALLGDDVCHALPLTQTSASVDQKSWARSVEAADLAISWLGGGQPCSCRSEHPSFVGFVSDRYVNLDRTGGFVYVGDDT